MYVYIGFKTFFYVVRQLDSFASYLPTGLHLGFCRSWPLFLPSSFSSVFLVLLQAQNLEPTNNHRQVVTICGVGAVSVQQGQKRCLWLQMVRCHGQG